MKDPLPGARHYSFFRHVDCEYFPCHKTERPEAFNCLFCYCPLYTLGDRCGGRFSYTAEGVKDCKSCLFPHQRENYEAITNRFSELAALAGQTEQRVLLAVNGTLMRGLALEHNLLDAGGTFCREAETEKSYRLWSVRDAYPAMLRVDPAEEAAASIAVEVWSVPLAGLTRVLLGEPAGLCVGSVRLSDGETVLGVLGEPALVKGMREITAYGGWRAYLADQ